MKRTARATKIEKLPDEEQIFVIGRIDARETPAKICAEYQARFQRHLAESTLYSYIQRRWLPSKIEAEQTVALAKEFINLRGQNPDIPEDVLLRGFLRQRQASKGFQEGLVDPKVIIGAELDMRKLDLEERRVKAVEQHNNLEEKRQDLKQRELDVAKQKIATATGGLDGRELYLRAAQDVLKKLHTYKELKAALAARRDEIVGELAHSAEAFVKKLEATA